MPIFTSSLQASSGSTVAVPISRSPTLYNVSAQTITFSNCAATGFIGPTLAQCQTHYGTTSPQPGYASWGTNLDLFVCDFGVQYWTVPATGTYRITVAGARGAHSGGSNYGWGAILTADYSLEAGDILRMVCGQNGVDGSSGLGGGGGGTYVALTKYGMLTLLMCAGGGAGVSNNDNGSGNQGLRHGRTSADGPFPGRGSAYNPTPISTDPNNNISDFWYGGGGACWGKDGLRGGAYTWTRGDVKVQNEGRNLASWVPLGGFSENGAHGGFGGGGATGRDSGSGGGGGGFQGGNAQYALYNNTTPESIGNTRGGGSYSLNATVSTGSGTGSGNNGHGYVTIVCPTY